MMLERTLNPVALKTKLTVEDFQALYPHETTEQVELLNGEILVSSPTAKHQDIRMALSIVLGSVIKSQQLGRLYAAPLDVYFDEYNYIQPDLFFVAKDNQNCLLNLQGKWAGAPDLCIEILSPSSNKTDRETKFDLYEQHGVREYWVVDPLYESVEIFIATPEGYQRQGLYTGDDQLTSTILPNLTIVAKTIFA